MHRLKSNLLSASSQGPLHLCGESIPDNYSPRRRRERRRGAEKLFLSTICLSLALFSTTARAQQKATLGASVPSPHSVLGFNPGDDRTIADWKQITNYFALLGKTSNRVRVQTIGQSTLGRTMIAAFISAPENIRNLEK